jgi:hypothetical protein
MKSSFRLPDKLIKRAVSIVLVAVLLAVVFGRSFDSEAIFDPDKAITYQNFAAKVSVENSVLFIGTYVIHKDALTDQLYEKAKDSASESGQNEVYYKSELSDGQWFNVGDIENGVKGISEDGRPENVETINPLYVTYYVGSDGILRDAKTMAAMNPFDIPDPYDLSGLPELEPIRTQYTQSQSATSISQSDYLDAKGSKDSGNLRSDVYTYQLLSTFFSLNLRDAQTDKCDQQLQGLNTIYIAYKADGKEEEAKLVYDLMEKVDATRRALIMERLAELDDNLLNTLYTLTSGSYYTPYGSFKDSSSESNASIGAPYNKELKDSLKHDFTGFNTADPFILSFLRSLGIVSSSSGWWTVLDDYDSNEQQRAEEANSDNDDYVYDKTPQEKPFNADSALLDAIGTSISNCSDSYTKYLSKALVDADDILGHAIYDYSSQVIDQSTGGSLGGPVDYLKHATNIRDNNISDKAGELSLLKSSLLNLASNKYSASATAGTGGDYGSLASAGAKTSYLEDRKGVEEADRSMLQFLIEAMRQRDEAENALEYVYQRIDWTENLLTTIPGDDYKTYSTSSVQAHLAWLKEEAQKIIDSDANLRSKLDALKAKKAELQKKRDACLDNNDLAGAKAYDAKIAAVDQDINKETGGKGDAGNMADKLVNKAMSALADNANADLAGVASALAEVGDKDAVDALADKAKESGASADTLAGINDANGDGDGSGDGSGKKDADALLAQLESLFGKSLDEMSDDELAIAGATFSKLSRSGITPADSLTKMVVNKLVDTNNKYNYRQYDGSKTEEYISLDTLSDCTAYRYFYDDAKATGTMTKGSNVYIFKRGSEEMHKQTPSSDAEQMDEKIVYSGTLFIGEDDAKDYFKCITEYANNTDYAICLTSPMQTKVDNYTETLTEFFKDE